MAYPDEVGQFIPTSQVWEIAQLQEVDVTKPEFKELLVRLYQQVNNIALSLNVKDSARYHTGEFVNGQVFFPNPALDSTSTTTPTERQVYRKVINFGALPGAGVTKPMPHGLAMNSGFTFTRIYGAASNTAGNLYIPLPYASSGLNNGVELWVDANDIRIRAQDNRAAYTVCYIVIEYLKS